MNTKTVTAMHTPVEIVWADFSDTLQRFILKRVGNEQAAEDVLQDVFMKIHASIAGLSDESRLQSWVYQITRNAIVDFYRKPQPGQELHEDLAAMNGDDDDRDVERKLARSLRGMVEQLPAEYRQTMVLTAFEGLTQREVADQLGLSLSAAKSRVQRGREKLRDLLLDCCHLEFDRRGRVIDYHPRVDCCKRCGESC